MGRREVNLCPGAVGWMCRVSFISLAGVSSSPHFADEEMGVGTDPRDFEHEIGRAHV